VLTGGAGADTLTGVAGVDRFVFDTFETKKEKYTIKDFVHDTDLLMFDDEVFTSLTAGPGGALDPFELTFGTKATTADHHLIYNQATGGLFYDADGVGGAAAVQIATLSTKPMLDAGDFMVF
jgi:Ca2+-binding RTX toxin-like protein